MTVRRLDTWVPISAASIEKAALMLQHLGETAIVLICARTSAPDVDKACESWPDRIPFPSVAYVHDSLLKDHRSWSLGGYEDVVIAEFIPAADNRVAVAEASDLSHETAVQPATAANVPPDVVVTAVELPDRIDAAIDRRVSARKSKARSKTDE